MLNWIKKLLGKEEKKEEEANDAISQLRKTLITSINETPEKWSLCDSSGGGDEYRVITMNGTTLSFYKQVGNGYSWRSLCEDTPEGLIRGDLYEAFNTFRKNELALRNQEKASNLLTRLRNEVTEPCKEEVFPLPSDTPPFSTPLVMPPLNNGPIKTTLSKSLS